MSKALMQALAAERKAAAEVVKTLQRDYPVGAAVKWAKKGIHHGVVLDLGHGDQLRVRNEKTGNESWISAYTIAEAMSLMEEVAGK